VRSGVSEDLLGVFPYQALGCPAESPHRSVDFEVKIHGSVNFDAAEPGALRGI